MRIAIVTNGVSEGQKRLEDTLVKDGHEVVFCANAEEALKQVADGAADLALSMLGETQVVGLTNVIPIGRRAARSEVPSSYDATKVLGQRGLTEVVEELEAKLVNEAMARTGNNQIRAAELLQITRGALQYKLKKYVKPEAA